jgi:hypothetical protein
MASVPQPLLVQNGVRTERTNNKLTIASSGRKNGEPLTHWGRPEPLAVVLIVSVDSSLDLRFQRRLLGRLFGSTNPGPTPIAASRGVGIGELRAELSRGLVRGRDGRPRTTWTTRNSLKALVSSLRVLGVLGALSGSRSFRLATENTEITEGTGWKKSARGPPSARTRPGRAGRSAGDASREGAKARRERSRICQLST